MKKKIVIGTLVVGLFMPSVADARSISVARPSVSVSRPTTSVSRPSTVSRPTTTSRPNTSTSKPSSLKSGTSTLKPTGGSSVPRVNKNTTNNKSSNTTNKNTTNTNKTSTKIDSGSYSVKPKTTTNKTQTSNNKTNYVISNPTYYNSYSSRPMGYNRGMGIWDYYMLNNIFNSNKKVSDRDIAKELEKQGYSNEETNKILKDIKKENKTSKKKKWGIGKTIMTILGALGVGAFILFLI